MSLKIRFVLILLTYLLSSRGESIAQWAGTYGNEWIKYSQPYVRVSVSSPGIHKISLDSLPINFPKNDLTKFQLWNRGKEVSIISASDNEIIFYGEPNDGASDSLVFRPSTDRLNPYTSLFSEERSYFLTVSTTAKRSKVLDGTSLTGEIEPYHIQRYIRKFDDYKLNTTQKGFTRESIVEGVAKQQFSFTSFGESSNLNHSYYNRSNAWVGEAIYGDSVKASVRDPLTNLFVSVPKLPKSYSEVGVLNNWKSDAERKPVLEILVNGLHVGYHNVGIYVSPSLDNIQTEQKLVSSLQFTGFGGEKRSTVLNKNVHISDNGEFNARVLSRGTTTSTDWIGVSYLTITYPQSIDMKRSNFAIFNLPANTKSISRVKIENVQTGAKIYDVSNIYEPYEIVGKYSDSNAEVMIPRVVGKDLKLLVTGNSGIIKVAKANIHNVNFMPVYSNPQFGTEIKAITPANYDYLVITNNTLKESAIEYAEYRSSQSGGSHKTLLVNIRDVYDQFNYGEPSPIAIRRFTNYMLKDGIREAKHNLLLLGHSVTLPVRIIKEMPDEVPTFGDPGSDILLVSGLQGVDINVPSIPVGRVGALNGTDLRNYLSKVKAYEHSEDLSWRKEVLHLNGGQSAAEISQLKDILAGLAPIIEQGELGGKVDARVKQNPAEGAIERVNITNEINRGVGMLTYFGHGAQIVTDLDMGYVTDATRNYNNANKYPLMFFNGCGVGNIYTSRSAHGLSGNWLLTGNLGSLAIISNSYK
ncbi:MAG TPA: C25 family cysteine peptidase, partial [Dyadobacter sp.]|nr:C25 family cysteine peptidase [Dyadobacter sp.]